MLAEREIHHLPVLDAGKVVGMVTDRDAAQAQERAATVADVLEPIHRVSAETPFSDVLDLMTSHNYDAVVVAENGHVEGIFTASDAVRVLATLVRRRAA